MRGYLSVNIGSSWVWTEPRPRERECFCEGRGLCVGAGHGEGVWRSRSCPAPALAPQSGFVLVSPPAWGAPPLALRPFRGRSPSGYLPGGAGLHFHSPGAVCRGGWSWQVQVVPRGPSPATCCLCSVLLARALPCAGPGCGLCWEGGSGRWAGGSLGAAPLVSPPRLPLPSQLLRSGFLLPGIPSSPLST